MYAALDDDTGFDEPVRDSKQSTARDSNAIAITQDMGRVQNALSEFDRVAAGLAELESRYPKDAIYAVETTKGMKDAVEHRAAWRDPRITVEKARKMAKAPLLAVGKNIDARAAWLTEKLREGEEPIDRLIKVEEDRKEAERQARANAEAGRIIAIQEALAEIGQDVLIAASKTSADIQALLDRMKSTQPDPLVFQEMLDQARAAWHAGIAKLETALKAKLWDEAEQKRIADEQAAEAERRAAEAARLAQVAAEQAEQAARLAAQQKAMDEQMAAMAAQQKVLDDAKAEAEARAQREAEAAEQARAAEAQRLADEQAAAEAEARRRAIGADATITILTSQDTPVQALQQVLKAEAPAPDATDRDAPASTSPSVGSTGAGPAADAAPSVAQLPTLKLSEIQARLHPLSITADGLELLGITAAGRQGVARMYFESDYPLICDAIAVHAELVKGRGKAVMAAA